MPGSSNACYARIKVVPIGIKLFDQSNFPGSIPLLQSFLANNRILNVIELFEIDQFVNAISLREAFHEFETMLTNPSDEVIRHADIERAILAACQNVDVAPTHCRLRDGWPARRPAMTSEGLRVCASSPEIQ